MQENYNLDVEWKAFDLRPGTPPQGIPRPPRHGDPEPGQPLTGPVGEAAEAAGLVMRRSNLIPYTRPAMELGEYAKAQGCFDAYHKLALRAYWEDGKNLGDATVLQELGEASGLEAEGLRRMLKERRYADAVEEAIQFAREVGIRGIPAYIIDRYLVVGAQPYPLFEQVADRVLREREQGAAT